MSEERCPKCGAERCVSLIGVDRWACRSWRPRKEGACVYRSVTCRQNELTALQAENTRLEAELAKAERDRDLCEVALEKARDNVAIAREQAEEAQL